MCRGSITTFSWHQVPCISDLPCKPYRGRYGTQSKFRRRSSLPKLWSKPGWLGSCLKTSLQFVRPATPGSYLLGFILGGRVWGGTLYIFILLALFCFVMLFIPQSGKTPRANRRVMKYVCKWRVYVDRRLLTAFPYPRPQKKKKVGSARGSIVVPRKRSPPIFLISPLICYVFSRVARLARKRKRKRGP